MIQIIFHLNMNPIPGGSAHIPASIKTVHGAFRYVRCLSTIECVTLEDGLAKDLCKHSAMQ
jgi:hypothetical protein